MGRGREGKALWGPIAGCPRLTCALRLASIFFCLLFPTVLQHPGEQHRQSVRPPDHSQVSVGSASAQGLPSLGRYLSHPRQCSGHWEEWEWPGYSEPMS